MNQFIMAIVLLLGCLSVGCTHNNGDIGPWFGTWKLNAITINGDLDTKYSANENMVWKFQSSVVEMQEIFPMHVTSDHFGTWHQTSDDTVEMNFSYHDNNNPAGGEYYAPPSASHLPRGIFTMDILELTSSKMRLKYTDKDGIIYTYSLKKW